MSDPTWRAIEVLTRQFELCDVLREEHAVVLVDDQCDPAVTTACNLALERLGAHRHTLVIGDERGDEREVMSDPVVRAAFGAADVVVDLTHRDLDHDDRLRAVLGDARMLLVGARSMDELHDLVPHVGAVRRVERGEAVLANAQKLVVAADTGTSLTIDLKWSKSKGISDVTSGPGSIGRWPSSRLVVAPASESANGTLVLMPGDAIVTFGEFVRSPVTLTIENDHICDIDGESAAADLIRAHLEASGQADAYGLADVTIGLVRVVRARPPELLDPRLLPTAGCEAGSVTIATGTNHVAGRKADLDLRLLLRHTSVLVDTRPLVDRGELRGEIAPDAYELAAGPR